MRLAPKMQNPFPLDLSHSSWFGATWIPVTSAKFYQHSTEATAEAHPRAVPQELAIRDNKAMVKMS